MDNIRELVVPDWTEQASCIDQWDIFDNGFDPYPTRVCKNCPVRTECLVSALRFEQDEIKRGMGEFVVVGIRGGYTVPERRDLHRAIQQSGWDVIEDLL